MKTRIISRLLNTALLAVVFIMGGLLWPRLAPSQTPQQEALPTTVAQAVEPTETIPPNTPLPSITPRPTATLRPPPTLEPPTPIPQPTNTSAPTETAVFIPLVEVTGIRGLETPAPTSTAGCVPRADWRLTYEVQANDALESIAARYGTWVQALADGNCLIDINLIIVGQRLRVPGEAHPEVPQYACGWELLAPMNHAFNISGDGPMTFSWIGPRSPRNLIRVYRANDWSHIVWEETIDLRQNHTIQLSQTIPEGGEYMWYVYPLDLNFQQIACVEGGPWYFHKSAAS